jgi:hypothetical protein
MPCSLLCSASVASLSAGPLDGALAMSLSSPGQRRSFSFPLPLLGEGWDGGNCMRRSSKSSPPTRGNAQVPGLPSGSTSDAVPRDAARLRVGLPVARWWQGKNR